MLLCVGSNNSTKVAAVRDAVALYPEIFPDPQVVGADVEIDQFGHPKNLEEVIEGAISRARKAFDGCSFSFGLEGGLMAVPHSRSGFMEVNACAIYDGSDVVLGLGPAVEWPKKMTELIVSGQADGSQAFRRLGLTEHEKIGAVPGGIMSVLSHGRMSREDFMKYSVMMAVVQLQNREWYELSKN